MRWGGDEREREGRGGGGRRRRPAAAAARGKQSACAAVSLPAPFCVRLFPILGRGRKGAGVAGVSPGRGGGRGRGGRAAGQRLKGPAGSLLPPAFLPCGPPPRWMAAAAVISSVLPLGGDGAGAGPAGPGSEAAAMEGRRRLWRLVGGTARREGAEEPVGLPAGRAAR